jgi:hypothetical protein
MIKAPTPFGPPNLCAETIALFAPNHSKEKGILPTACVTSLKKISLGNSWRMPVSELAN